jgi:Tfp pilus assembly protein PilF
MRRVNHALSLTVLIALALSGCTLAGPSPGGSPSPAGGAAGPNAPPAETAPPAQAPPAPPRQFRVGAAAATLVEQAHRQAAGGDYVAATATLERALRIEPDNPLLWLELGRVRLSENNPAQADAMGRKALALATGDPSAQASAWRLIAEALRALGRNPEAADAERHAAGLATH